MFVDNASKYMIGAKSYLGYFTQINGLGEHCEKEVPTEWQNNRTRKTGTAIFCYDRELTLLSYKPKPPKVLFLLSTKKD